MNEWVCCRVADHFRIRGLLIEAMCILCSKASVEDLAILKDLIELNQLEDLQPCVKQLWDEKRRQSVASELLSYKS